jgi:hypothetical protein
MQKFSASIVTLNYWVRLIQTRVTHVSKPVCSSIEVTCYVSHAHKTAGKTDYNLILRILDSRPDGKIHPNGSRSPYFITNHNKNILKHLCKDTWLGITGCGQVPSITLREVLPHADKCSNLFLCFASMCNSNCTQGKWSAFVMEGNTYRVTLFTFSCRFEEVSKKALENVHSLISVSVTVTHAFETRFWNAVLRKLPYFKQMKVG